MPPARDVLEPASLPSDLGPRFAALIRLSEAIRSHPDEKDLFGTLVNELREVVGIFRLEQHLRLTADTKPVGFGKRRIEAVLPADFGQVATHVLSLLAAGGQAPSARRPPIC